MILRSQSFAGRRIADSPPSNFGVQHLSMQSECINTLETITYSTFHFIPEASDIWNEIYMFLISSI